MLLNVHHSEGGHYTPADLSHDCAPSKNSEPNHPEGPSETEKESWTHEWPTSTEGSGPPDSATARGIKGVYTPLEKRAHSNCTDI